MNSILDQDSLGAFCRHTYVAVKGTGCRPAAIGGATFIIFGSGFVGEIVVGFLADHWKASGGSPNLVARAGARGPIASAHANHCGKIGLTGPPVWPVRKTEEAQPCHSP